MSGHGGCKTGCCASFVTLHGQPLLIDYAVMLNQIELNRDGVQGYRMTGNGPMSHRFRSIIGVIDRWPLYRGVATMSESSKSVVSFAPVDPDQPGFFPAQWTFDLDLDFRLDVPMLGFSADLTTAEPLPYAAKAPLTGFPPLKGPNFELVESVPLLSAKSGKAVGEIHKGSLLMPIDDVLFDVAVTDLRSEKRSVEGGYAMSFFSAKVSVSLREPFAASQGVNRLSATVAAVPTENVRLIKPGNDMGLSIPPEQRVLRASVGRDKPFEFELEGSIDPTSTGHSEVSVFVGSQDRRIKGFGEVEILLHHLLDPPDAGDEVLHHLPKLEVRGGDVLDVALPSDAVAYLGGDVDWVAPHGVTLVKVERPGAARFQVPSVSVPSYVWFTAYEKENAGSPGRDTLKYLKQQVIVNPA